jgi:hypothetical protein
VKVFGTSLESDQRHARSVASAFRNGGYAEPAGRATKKPAEFWGSWVYKHRHWGGQNANPRFSALANQANAHYFGGREGTNSAVHRMDVTVPRIVVNA